MNGVKFRRIHVTFFICFSPLVFGGDWETVTVRKVPAPRQYAHWTDDMQMDADPPPTRRTVGVKSKVFI